MYAQYQHQRGRPCPDALPRAEQAELEMAVATTRNIAEATSHASPEAQYLALRLLLLTPWSETAATRAGHPADGLACTLGRLFDDTRVSNDRLVPIANHWGRFAVPVVRRLVEAWSAAVDQLAKHNPSVFAQRLNIPQEPVLDRLDAMARAEEAEREERTARRQGRRG
jgi:hypothetical protein